MSYPEETKRITSTARWRSFYAGVDTGPLATGRPLWLFQYHGPKTHSLTHHRIDCRHRTAVPSSFSYRNTARSLPWELFTRFTDSYYQGGTRHVHTMPINSLPYVVLLPLHSKTQGGRCQSCSERCWWAAKWFGSSPWTFNTIHSFAQQKPRFERILLQAHNSREPECSSIRWSDHRYHDEWSSTRRSRLGCFDHKIETQTGY